jgi:hypothetical protein
MVKNDELEDIEEELLMADDDDIGELPVDIDEEGWED